jgi:hypothetical protein
MENKKENRKQKKNQFREEWTRGRFHLHEVKGRQVD